MRIVRTIAGIFAPHTSYAKKRTPLPPHPAFPTQPRHDKIVKARLEDVRREFRKIFREVGTDLGRVSSDCGFADEPCAKFHGTVISVLGKTERYPTLDNLDANALFNADTYHRIDYVDPIEL